MARLVALASAAAAIQLQPTFSAAVVQKACGQNPDDADEICASFCGGTCSFYNATSDEAPHLENLTLYRVTPRNVTDIANKNTGDPPGDIGFYLSRKSLVVECRDDPTNQRCFLAGDNIFAQFVVEVDGNYGGYHMCNPDQYPWGDDTKNFECFQDCMSPPNCGNSHHNGSGWHGGVQCFCERSNKTVGRESRGASRDKSDCHFRKTATKYDRKPVIKWLICTAK
jgi:hypothetical protein